MSRSVFLFLQLYITSAFPWQGDKSDTVSATLLRGSQTTDAKSDASKHKLKPDVARGHLFYATACADCDYKSIKWGCEPAMEYLACLTTHCYHADHEEFVKTCSVLQSHSFSELDISCRGSETTCRGKFHQLSSGGLGANWDPNAVFENAFCGPYGTCIGDINMNVIIHNMPALVQPAPTEGQSKPCDLTQPVALSAQPGIWLECGLPIATNANINRKEDWVLCVAEAKADKAACSIPMAPKLAAQEALEGYCILTEGKAGKRLTQPLWREVANPTKIEKSVAAQTPHVEYESEVVSVDDAKKEAGAETVRSMDEADQNEPPWMKNSDSERKLPPGYVMGKDVDEIKRATRDTTSAGVRGTARTARQTSKRAGREKERLDTEAEHLEKDAAEAWQPIVKGTEELDRLSDKKSDEVAESASHARDEVSKDARNIHKAAKKVEKIKPPYMKNSKAEEKAPLPEIRYFAQPIVQVPAMREFA